MIKISDGHLLGLEELSGYLGIKKATLYVWVCQKKIPYVKVGRLVKFDSRKIEKWLEESSVEVYNMTHINNTNK